MSRDATPGAGIVVSGLGAVGAFGLGREALVAALESEQALATVEVDRSAGYHRAIGARRALLVAGHDLAPYLPPGAARRLSPPARFAIAATRLALADAGLAQLSRAEFERTAIVSGTSFGPPWVTEVLLRQILTLGPEAASPALFTESVASASASQVALLLGARGPSLTFTGREASDLLALGGAFRLVRSGAADRAIVLVVEEMIPLLHALLDRFDSLSRSNGIERARPFDLERDGFLASEGAVAVVLEPRGTLERRGGRAHCTLLAAGSGFDPTATAWGFGHDDDSLAARLARGLERAAAGAGETDSIDLVDLVVAGASGSRGGDRLLGRALNRLFTDPPPIAAPKSRVGEFGGAYLGAVVAHASGARVRAVDGFETADPEIGIAPHDGSPLAAPRRTLAATVAAGGAWAWALLGSPGEPSLPAGV